MSSRKQVPDEERKNLEKMLHGNYYGYGTYGGRGILFQRLAKLICPNCGNRMYKIWLIRKPEEGSSKRVIITYTLITIGVVVCIYALSLVIDKTEGRVLNFLDSKAFEYGFAGSHFLCSVTQVNKPSPPLFGRCQMSNIRIEFGKLLYI